GGTAPSAKRPTVTTEPAATVTSLLVAADWPAARMVFWAMVRSPLLAAQHLGDVDLLGGIALSAGRLRLRHVLGDARLLRLLLGLRCRLLLLGAALAD